MSAGVRFDWRVAGTVDFDSDGKPVLPSLPASPGLYRLSFAGLDARPRIYVGEADDLRRRLAGYRNPGPSQRTNQRVNALLRTHLRSGGDVGLAIAVEAVLTLGGRAEEPLDLSRKASRLLAENTALLALRGADAVDIENLG